MLKLMHRTSFEPAMELFARVKRFVYSEYGVCAEEYFFVLAPDTLGELVYTLGQLHHLRAEGKVCLLLPQEYGYLKDYWPAAADIMLLLERGQYDELLRNEPISFRYPGWPFVCKAALFADGRFDSELMLRNGRLSLRDVYAYALGLKFGAAMAVPAEEAGAQAPRTALLVADAGGEAGLPPAYWDRLAAALRERGYAVRIANAAGGVPGLLRELRGASLAVMPRCGLADLLAAALPPAPYVLAALYPVDAGASDARRQPGVSRKGLNLARCTGSGRVLDIEVAADASDPGAVMAELAPFLS